MVDTMVGPLSAKILIIGIMITFLTRKEMERERVRERHRQWERKMKK